MNSLRGLLGCLLVLVSGAALAQSQSQPVPLNQTINIVLPASTAGYTLFPEPLVIDVPVGVRRIEVSLSGVQSNRDIDLYLSRNPFAVGTGAPNDPAEISDFYSVTSTVNETVVISELQNPPLHGGTRWYIGVGALAGAESTASLTVTTATEAARSSAFSVIFEQGDGCLSNGWSDPTPIGETLGGNPATTLGQARRNAFERAVEILDTQVNTPVPLRLRACWKNLSSPGGPLAQAAPAGIARGTPGLIRPQFWHARPVIARNAGVGYCELFDSIPGSADCQGFDLFIEFNADIGTGGTLAWWYGFDPNPIATSRPDFIAIALHEISHGLGFISLISLNEQFGPIGSLPQGRFDAYAANLLDFRNPQAVKPLNDPTVTDADRAAVIRSVDRLRWGGVQATKSSRNNGIDALGRNLIMYAPATIEGGSSVSHVDQRYCTLMAPRSSGCEIFRGLGVTSPILHEVGWSPSTRRPYTGLWLDRTKPVTGFDLHPVAVDEFGNGTYFLVFYTYGADNTPEWYLAFGKLIDGAFSGDVDASGNSLVRYTYDANQQPAQRPDAANSGQIYVNFNNAGEDPACAGDRSGALSLAVLEWTLPEARRSWCIEPLVGDTQRPQTDFTTVFFGGEEDAGWGVTFTIIQAAADAPIFLAGVLYYYDAAGQPRWAYGDTQIASLDAVVEVPMRSFTGYCRTCPPPDAQALVAQSQEAGTVRMRFNSLDPTDPLNTGSVQVVYPGAPGGSWTRSERPLTLFSLSREKL